MNLATFQKGKALVFALLLSLAAFALPASASGGIDVSSVTSAINGAAAPIASIGAAVLVILVGVKVYKWIRRAL